MNNLEMMRKRFDWQGGIRQEDRMIKDKWRTFQRTLQYSYQGCNVRKEQQFDEVLDLNGLPFEGESPRFPQFRALINPDKLKQSYDDKILSINFDSEFHSGDIFQWINTDTYWIFYLNQITEDAYLRGEIRRCKYRIKFKDEDGVACSTWAAIRGPIETQITSIQKNQDRIDYPNLSLNILMPLNSKTRAAFERYKVFLFDERAWRIEAIDRVSMDNVLEITAEEYYINETKDDVENELKDGLVIEEYISDDGCEIKGETFIKPSIAEKYYMDISGGDWKIIEKDVPVRLTVVDDNTVSLIWNKMTSGQFTLQWSKDKIVMEKAIVVESLF